VFFQGTGIEWNEVLVYCVNQGATVYDSSMNEISISNHYSFSTTYFQFSNISTECNTFALRTGKYRVFRNYTISPAWTDITVTSTPYQLGNVYQGVSVVYALK